MDDMKRESREAVDETKKAWRRSDGEDLDDKVANLGDDVRRKVADTGDDLRHAGDHVAHDIKHGVDEPAADKPTAYPRPR